MTKPHYFSHRLTNHRLKFIVCALAALSIGLAGQAATLLTTSTDSIEAVQLQSGATIALSALGGTPGQNQYNNSEGPLKAFDDNATTKYLNYAGPNTGVLIDAANDLLPLNAITLTTANDSEGRDPLTFSIYGTNVSMSTNFSDYTPIVLNQSITLSTTRETTSDLVTFANTTVYDSYMVIFPTVKSVATGGGMMQVAEISLYSTVPEPSAWAMIAGGAGILIFGRRLRCHRA